MSENKNFETAENLIQAIGCPDNGIMADSVRELFENIAVYKVLEQIGPDTVNDVEVLSLSLDIDQLKFVKLYEMKLSHNTNIFCFYFYEVEQIVKSVIYGNTILSPNSIKHISAFPTSHDEEYDMEIFNEFLYYANDLVRKSFNRAWHISSYVLANKMPEIIHMKNHTTDIDFFTDFISNAIEEWDNVSYNRPYLNSIIKSGYGYKFIYKDGTIPYSYIRMNSYIGIIDEDYKLTHVGLWNNGNPKLIPVDDINLISEVESAISSYYSCFSQLESYLEETLLPVLI